MKILVTVGTTSFDSLIQYLDESLDRKLDATFQIAEGKYIPKNFNYFRFSEDIDCIYNNNDIIITHAGAGSIYNLLEKNKLLFLIPNLDRIDKHQTDIATFMHNNNYAIKINNLKEINTYLGKANDIKLNPFKKIDFFKTDEILAFITE